jgi:hypothetical protein
MCCAAPDIKNQSALIQMGVALYVELYDAKKFSVWAVADVRRCQCQCNDSGAMVNSGDFVPTVHCHDTDVS